VTAGEGVGVGNGAGVFSTAGGVAGIEGAGLTSFAGALRRTGAGKFALATCFDRGADFAGVGSGAGGVLSVVTAVSRAGATAAVSVAAQRSSSSTTTNPATT